MGRGSGSGGVGGSSSGSTVVSMSEYCLGFADLFGGEDTFTNDFVHVYVANRFSMGGKRYTAAGRFTSEEEHLDACERLVSDMNRLSFRLWNFDVISVSAHTAFQIYVDSQRSESIRRRRGTTSLALSNDGSRDSDSAAAKRLKLSNELTKARSQIAECERKLLAARKHYHRLANEEQATPPSSLPPATAQVGSIHVILDGKAVTIPITDIIYMSDILDRMITNGSQLSPSAHCLGRL
jgi:hypothetical protein